MVRKIFKTGHSLAVTLSAKLLEQLGLKLGDDVAVELDIDHERLTIAKAGKRQQLSLNLSSRPKLGQVIAKR